MTNKPKYLSPKDKQNLLDVIIPLFESFTEFTQICNNKVCKVATFLESYTDSELNAVKGILAFFVTNIANNLYSDDRNFERDFVLTFELLASHINQVTNSVAKDTIDAFFDKSEEIM